MDSYSSEDFFSLDSEYHDSIQNREWMEVAEYRLIWAIIERAVRDVLGNQPAEVANAIDWLWSEETNPADPYSFQWCCEMLEIQIETLREKIVRTRNTLDKAPLNLPSQVESQAA